MLNLYALSFLALICTTNSFTPSKNLQILTEFIDHELEKSTSVSKTLTHMDILKKGLVRSVAKYFGEKQENKKIKIPKRSIELNKTDVYFNNLNELYRDYLGDQEYELISSCSLGLNDVINLMAKAVAAVDSDPTLKDLPWAHFDANTFIESNSYVSNLITTILHDVLVEKKFDRARIKIGQALHTIHDFYSHSNWVEMGNTDKINSKIGSGTDDLGTEIARRNDIDCLSDNCTKQIIQCKYLKGLSVISNRLSLKIPINCPIVYFKCTNNVIQHKLTSGYYSGQKLPNGDQVIKPSNRSKCSHGGYLDQTSLVSSYGGINKDTGYYFLSPHADLHLKAANLAIDHTEEFFNFLRIKIGDENFEELLQLLNPGLQNSKFFCYFKKIFS